MTPSETSPETKAYDVIVLGAGGAGMFCAIQAGKRGRNVLILDHAKKLGGKILISGGGRCNFTNLGASPAQYVSQNPHFVKSALSRFRPADFIALVEAHGIAYHEKKLGQQFCDGSAAQIVELLENECRDAGVEIRLETQIDHVEKIADSGPARFLVRTPAQNFTADSVVVALGGLSIPKIGATGFGYELAKRFGLKQVPRAPALDGFTFAPAESERFRALAGISVDCTLEAGGLVFRENILFTHSGLSGPAALQASLHWHAGETITLDVLPGQDLFAWFMTEKKAGNRAIVRNVLAGKFAARFADLLCQLHLPNPAIAETPLPQASEKALEAFCRTLHAWKLSPAGTVGYSKAEVTRGGVDTDELSSKTLEAKKVPGLYFIGEVVDVTGWLGGYNFQWAWASGWAAGQVV